MSGKPPRRPTSPAPRMALSRTTWLLGLFLFHTCRPSLFASSPCLLSPKPSLGQVFSTVAPPADTTAGPGAFQMSLLPVVEVLQGAVVYVDTRLRSRPVDHAYLPAGAPVAHERALVRAWGEALEHPPRAVTDRACTRRPHRAD